MESLPPNYDILAPDIDPVVAQIQYGGKQQHAVTLMGGFIFDANHKRALGARLPHGTNVRQERLPHVRYNRAAASQP